MSQSWTELLMRDHETTEKVFDAGEKAFNSDSPPDPNMVGKLVEYLADYVDGIHNKKEEDHLFPLIEQRGVPRHGGPLAVMLQEHEESKKMLARFKELGEAYSNGRTEALAELKVAFLGYTDLLKNHYWKENDILYPLAQRVMTPEDGETVLRGIEAVEAAAGPETHKKYYALAEELMNWGNIKDLAFGLDHATLGSIINTLPVELSFVDADDTVRYFSHENHAKIFPRTRGAIGMKVQNCHPPDSVHLVNRILADFKAGTRDCAEFWIGMGDKKVHIRYWPVLDNDGKYIGCLETVQDVAGIQALEGERRLLDDA